MITIQQYHGVIVVFFVTICGKIITINYLLLQLVIQKINEVASHGDCLLIFFKMYLLWLNQRLDIQGITELSKPTKIHVISHSRQSNIIGRIR